MRDTFPIGSTILFAAAALAASPLASAATPSKTTAPVHRGLYINADLGLANSHVDFTGANVRSSALSVNLRVGYVLKSHLIVSADESATVTANDPNSNGYMIFAGHGYYFGSNLLGVGLTRYFGNNLLVGFTGGVGQTTLNFDNAIINSHIGFGSQVRIGKEWPANHGWRLGIVGGVDHVTAAAATDLTVFDALGGAYTARSDQADATTFFVSFTATFNK